MRNFKSRAIKIIVSGISLVSLLGISTPAFAELRLPGEDCQLPSGPRDWAAWGFPRAADKLPNAGVINAQILFVDFVDARGTDENRLRSVAGKYINNFKKFYSLQSSGQVKFNFSYVPKYINLPTRTTKYKMNLRKGQNGEGGLDYFRDSIKASDDLVDYSNIDLVYVIPSNTNREITFGPTVGGVQIETKEKVITQGAVAGTDSRLRENSPEWVWLAHETGHLFGIGHPWKTNTDAQGRWLSAPDYPVWDLMLHMENGMTSNFLGWSRFLIGWITPQEVVCLDANELGQKPSIFSINPALSSKPGEEFLFIKTGKYTGVAVEVRARGGLNNFPKNWEGPLVYEVDTRKVGNEGAVKLVKGNSLKYDNLPVGTLSINQKVVTSGISIKYLGKSKSQHLISISR